jgi:carboxymethylenebutenolidase
MKPPAPPVERPLSATAPGVAVLGGGAYERALAELLETAGLHAVAGALEASVEELRRRGAAAVYVLGFDEAGREALLAGAREGIAGVVAFHPEPAVERDGVSPLGEARAGRLVAPVLAFYGGADDAVADAEITALYDALNAAHVLEETVVYDGAPRGFFDAELPGQAQACADAWHRLLRFVGVPA